MTVEMRLSPWKKDAPKEDPLGLASVRLSVTAAEWELNKLFRIHVIAKNLPETGEVTMGWPIILGEQLEEP